MKVAAAFAFAAWMGFVAASAVAIYGFDSFERIYGKWGTFHMILWLTIPLAVVCGISAFVGLKSGSRGSMVSVPNRRLLAASTMFGAWVSALVGALALASEFAQPVWLFWVFSILSALIGGRMLAARSC